MIETIGIIALSVCRYAARIRSDKFEMKNGSAEAETHA
jgi:hypothetical protein